MILILNQQMKSISNFTNFLINTEYVHASSKVNRKLAKYLDIKYKNITIFNQRKENKMTVAKFQRKVRSLKGAITELIEEKLNHIIKSGCLDEDIKIAENDFTLPHAFMAAIGMEIERKYKPPTEKGKIDIINLFLNFHLE